MSNLTWLYCHTVFINIFLLFQEHFVQRVADNFLKKFKKLVERIKPQFAHWLTCFNVIAFLWPSVIHFIIQSTPLQEWQGLDWCRSWSSNTLATWCEEPTHWKRPWCWERLRAGGEGGNRGWDDWMASLTQWTWVWTNSGRRWRTRKPGVLQSVGWQRVGHSSVAKKTPPQQMDRPSWNNQQSKAKQNIWHDVLFRFWTSGNKYEDPREMRVRHGAQSRCSACGLERIFRLWHTEGKPKRLSESRKWSKA